jgi:hypothetical protein
MLDLHSIPNNENKTTRASRSWNKWENNGRDLFHGSTPGSWTLLTDTNQVRNMLGLNIVKQMMARCFCRTEELHGNRCIGGSCSPGELCTDVIWKPRHAS